MIRKKKRSKKPVVRSKKKGSRLKAGLRTKARVKAPAVPIVPLHPAEQYAQDVLDGKIVVGEWVRKAVERHRRDLETAAKRGLVFDPAGGDRVIRFFKFCKHSKGEWAGQTIVLEPWQQFILWVLFGWKKPDPKEPGEFVRRFRTSYVKVARKNGKSTWAAGVGLYLLVADNENGAEVYSAATKKDQACIVHGDAVAMVKKSPDLLRRVKVFKNNLNIPETRSKFEPLGQDEDTTDGLNVHGAIIDELHAHKTRGMLDVLDSGTGARRQPLIFIITTAGTGTVNVDQEEQKYAQKILDGIIEDDNYFAIIYAIDEKDEWREGLTADGGGCWIKANPNLGISVSLEDLRAKCRKAIEMPSAQNEFLQKHMNRQTSQVTLWIPMDKWRECQRKIPDEALAGRRCFMGMDLSSKLDVASVAAVFPPTEDDPNWQAKVRMYVPEATAEMREKKASVPYLTWGREKHLKLTPGNVIDYEYIKSEIFEMARVFEVVEVAYDPWNATQIAIQLQEEGLTVVEVGQGYRSLSEPAKEFEKLVTSRRFGHDGNPVLDWMASNVSIEQDPAGNIKPSKKKSTEKIDGIAAIVTAMARAMLQVDGGGSGYDDEGRQAEGRG